MSTKLVKRKGNSRVSSFQDQLRAAGFNPGKSDGIWGRRTDAAWKQALAAGYENLNGRLIKKKINQPLLLIEALPQQAGLFSSGSSNTSSTYVPWTPSLKAGQTYFENGVKVEDCARYANKALKLYKDKRDRTLYTEQEIGGDAWTRLSAGEHAKMVYSGYDGMEYDTSNKEDQNNYRLYLDAVKRKDQKSAKRYRDLLLRSVRGLSRARNALAADNFYKNFDSNTLDRNKTYLVNMYYNNSPNMGVAWYGAKNGTTGTHTGNLYWNPETNSWRISHSIHGVIHDDDFIQAQGSRNRFGYGVTAIAEAPMVDYTRRDWDKEHPIKAAINKIYDFGMWRKGGRLIPKAQPGTTLPEVTVTAINPNRFENGSDARKFVTALNSNRQQLMKRYNLSDLEYADMSKFAVNIALKESGLGGGVSYTLRQYIPDSVLHLMKRVVRNSDTPLSRGLTQIKYGSDIKDPDLKREYDYFDINEKNLVDNPDKMAQATIARAIINKRNLNSKKGANNYHYANGELIPEDVALALYWNRGKLTDYANPDPSNLDVGGATGYARRFEHQKIIM